MIVSIPVEIYRFFDIDDTQLTEFITSNYLDIEKDIEATTNNRAKQAYNEFAAKVKQKQEQN